MKVAIDNKAYSRAFVGAAQVVRMYVGDKQVFASDLSGVVATASVGLWVGGFDPSK